MAEPMEAFTDEIAALDRLRWASWGEASTLLALLLIGVPLRHLYGWHAATLTLGPIHGVAFLGFTATLLRASSGAHWPRRETGRALIAALLPFGGFVNERRLRRQQADLVGRRQPIDA